MMLFSVGRSVTGAEHAQFMNLERIEGELKGLSC